MESKRLFFGKIDKSKIDQLTNNYYHAGKEKSWYNGLEIGDFVFPISDGKITKLWKVSSFSEVEGKVYFEVIKEYPKPIKLLQEFIRYKHFNLNLNLLNKSQKPTANQKKGFFPIDTHESCPAPDKIEFEHRRNLYIALDGFQNKLPLKAHDIVILIGDNQQKEINGIKIQQGDKLLTYEILNDLYLLKNSAEERYGLKELLKYAKEDSAPHKQQYLTAVIDALKEEGYFPITNPINLYDKILVGRKVTRKSKKKGKIAPPKIEPEGDDIPNLEEYKDYAKLLEFNPNLILVGPPGTGKTYSVEKIIESFEYQRTNTYLSYGEMIDSGRVSFITFHQSFAYEEFVEGLRPVVFQEEDTNTQLQYSIQNGVLLDIANRAVGGQLQEEYVDDDFQDFNNNARIWKISLGSRGREETIYRDCINSNTIAIGWLPNEDLNLLDKDSIYDALIEENSQSEKPRENYNPTNDTDSIHKFVHELAKGDLVLVFATSNSIRAIGIVDGDYQLNSSYPLYQHKRTVKWLEVFEEPINILGFNDNKILTLKTLYELNRFTFSDIKEMLSEKVSPKINQTIETIPYFLVIDEINRGNISKVFGELITLIEKDKRDKLKVILPYSKKPFTLPSNLYIIGTMNTSDRSIALLDTALRRRFIFKELTPNPEVIRKLAPLNDDDLDMATILEIINSKIAKRLDRDHKIGHAYFLNVFDLNQLKIVWYYQIIPLLMEYFFNEGNEIAAIITEAFIDKETCEIKWIAPNNDFKQAMLTIK